jgi:predicted nucleic acid-binding protein
MTKKPALLLETDILTEYFFKKPSVMRGLLKENVCYTSFVQMSEILSCAETEGEREVLMKPFIGLRVLGFHSRYSGSLAEFLQESENISDVFKNRDKFRFCLVAAIAREARLTIATRDFSGIYKNLKNISTIETAAGAS